MNKPAPWTWRKVIDLAELVLPWLAFTGLLVALILLDARSLEQNQNGEHNEQQRTEGIQTRTDHHCTDGLLAAPPAGMARWVDHLPEPCTAVDTLAASEDQP